MRLRRTDWSTGKPLTWLWDNRIPLGCITLIAGDPGTGKSQLTCDLAAHVSCEQRWVDGTETPLGSVLMANAEDDEEAVLIPRLEAAGARRQSVLSVVSVLGDRELFSIPDSLPGLEKVAERLDPPVKLIIVDPIEAYYSRWVNPYSNMSVRQALKPLGDMAERLSCSVVLVQHMPKDNHRPAIYRFSGSIGVVGAARAGYLVTRNGNLSVLASAKTNWGDKPDALAYAIEPYDYTNADGIPLHTSRIRWKLPPLDATADDILLGEDENPAEVRDAMSFLQEILGTDSVGAKEVYAEAKGRNIERRSLARAAKLLGVVYAKGLNGKGPVYYWSLPSDRIIFDPGEFLH